MAVCCGVILQSFRMGSDLNRLFGRELQRYRFPTNAQIRPLVKHCPHVSPNPGYRMCHHITPCKVFTGLITRPIPMAVFARPLCTQTLSAIFLTQGLQIKLYVAISLFSPNGEPQSLQVLFCIVRSKRLPEQLIQPFSR